MLCCVAQVLFALNGRHLINEMGAVEVAAARPITIEGLAATRAAIRRELGTAEFERMVGRLSGLIHDLRALIAGMADAGRPAIGDRAAPTDHG